jgi:hypothetical protein
LKLTKWNKAKTRTEFQNLLPTHYIAPFWYSRYQNSATPTASPEKMKKLSLALGSRSKPPNKLRKFEKMISIKFANRTEQGDWDQPRRRQARSLQPYEQHQKTDQSPRQRRLCSLPRTE